MEYYRVFITNLPSFYKINLYNEINKQKKILVLYTGGGEDMRNVDFFSGEMNFEHMFILGGRLTKIFQIIRVLKTIQYKEVIIGGWDSVAMWTCAIISRKSKNAVVVESSDYESKTKGLKGFSKRLFISRVSKAYVSGSSQKRLVENLHFLGTVVKTKGVGVFNYISQPKYEARSVVKNFIYVGRLSLEKNLIFLINIFNQMPQYTLGIVGFGPQEAALKAIAKNNVIFMGAISNKDLCKYYQSNDVFILPSISEPWGLVVEEALNNGLPVVVSDKVGCHDEIINETNGLIFESNNANSLIDAITKISDVNFHNNLRYNISQLDFETIEQNQINCYL